MDSPKKIDHYFSTNPQSDVKYGLISTKLRGKLFEFITCSGVFSPKNVDLGTRILIESMHLPHSGLVLDIGCGYGAVGIAAAAINPKLEVILTDVNIRAINLAYRNVEKNNLRNIEVKHGNLYKPVQNLKFDCVLCNPPVSAGMKTVEEIIQKAPQVMENNGTFQMVIRSKIGKKKLPTIFQETFGNFEVLAIKSGYRILMAKKTQLKHL